MFPFPEIPMSQVERITAQHTLENSNIEELLKSHLPATISNDSHLKRPGYNAVIRIMGAPYSTKIQEVTSLLRGHVKLTKPVHRGGSRFNGFLTQEELSLMENHAVTQRRFPWYRTDLYTVGQRNGIFQATRTMVQTAMEKIEKREVHLDMRTVNQLVEASLHCPGFNPRMKLCLVQLSKELGLLRHMPEEWLAYFPFDTLTWLKPYNQVALEVRLKIHIPTLTQQESILITRLVFCWVDCRGGPPSDTESHGLLNLWRDEGRLARWGPVWFEWSVEDIDPTWKMIDCITYEKDLMQRLIEVGLNTDFQ
ncbi:hypothetical protein N7456_007166 [Penicillium angulare]|uniref:Uncharacterized protein n=1 Tax=Penicillium angulare TaxID=116970 RepID=A0A9W9KCD2_9EURO|nr:hypothetical protein N7456_007166 [Penicillium angulare]